MASTIAERVYPQVVVTYELPDSDGLRSRRNSQEWFLFLEAIEDAFHAIPEVYMVEGPTVAGLYVIRFDLDGDRYGWAIQTVRDTAKKVERRFYRALP
jgi:hypothetical protein